MYDVYKKYNSKYPPINKPPIRKQPVDDVELDTDDYMRERDYMRDNDCDRDDDVMREDL